MPFCTSCGSEAGSGATFCSKCGKPLAESSPAQVTAAPVAEKQFFCNAQALVTNARFVVAGQTYAMSGITSVKNYRQDPARTGPILMFLVALFSVMVGCAVGRNGLGALFFGFLIGAIGVAWWVAQKPLYWVLLHSASGEMRALSSNDGQFIGNVIQALNQSIIYRR